VLRTGTILGHACGSIGRDTDQRNGNPAQGPVVAAFPISALATQLHKCRMPQKRLGLTARCTASTRATAWPMARLACPTIPATATISPYWPLALRAAMPCTNSVSPMGFIS